MYVLLVLAGVDALLPDVHISAFAWILIILLWVCKGAVKEARKDSAPKSGVSLQTGTPKVNDWIVSQDMPGVYSTLNQEWAITVTPQKDGSSIFHLWGEGDEENIRLRAQNIGEAMDRADKIIDAAEGE